MDIPVGDNEISPPRRRPSIDERFDDFHTSHPWVFEALEELIEEWIESGGGRISIKALFEQLRWPASRQRVPPIRLNNIFTSRYARLLRHEHPEWANAFETRRLRNHARSDRDSLTSKVNAE
ncbi:hypothetical protein H9Y04_35230 [Streptomyces sp. TRM66268-LWL]|uniref:Uncharacterized protein n=1 Tax=Streptomyces polyasparticus TaxID=2767826 RepID=A0ABR7SS67_9ACTN|nr:hypothetical protein [Streptomyces polyasparticus]MBC9717797.1 hypothetical protein [Streptomyces polyasparticus]